MTAELSLPDHTLHRESQRHVQIISAMFAVSRYSSRQGPSYQGILPLADVTLSPISALTGIASILSIPHFPASSNSESLNPLKDSRIVAHQVHLVDRGNNLGDAH